MSDAPETIWATGNKTMGSWNSGKVNPKMAPLQTEYRRADLPPTQAQIMADPRVKALVEAATPYISPAQTGDYKRQLRRHEALIAALAQLKGPKP